MYVICNEGHNPELQKYSGWLPSAIHGHNEVMHKWVSLVYQTMHTWKTLWLKKQHWVKKKRNQVQRFRIGSSRDFWQTDMQCKSNVVCTTLWLTVVWHDTQNLHLRSHQWCKVGVMGLDKRWVRTWYFLGKHIVLLYFLHQVWCMAIFSRECCPLEAHDWPYMGQKQIKHSI